MAVNEFVTKTGDFKVIGKRPIRHDGADKVTGRATYGSDISLQGMLYGRVLRSPHAHADIKSIDTTDAEAYPGVHAVITSEDFPNVESKLVEGGEAGSQDLSYMSANKMARGKVLYHGHPVAAVAAETRDAAEEAARLIKVEYEVLEPVLSARRGRDKSSPLLHDTLYTDTEGEKDTEPSNVAEHRIYGTGDIEKGFAEADIIVENEYDTATVHQGYIEPHNATALWREDGSLDIWCSSQGHFWMRNETAKILQHPVSKIKVTPMEIGGGFGGKTLTYLETPAALLSKKSGRPVKMWMDRTEVLQSTGPTPGSWIKVKVGATNDGKITAAQVEISIEAGGFPGGPLHPSCLTSLAPYNLENAQVDGYDVVVNKPKSAAYRAPGATMSEFAVETTMDELAEKLGMDSLEFHMLNASKEGDWRVDGPRFLRVGNIECIEAIKSSDHWKTPLQAATEPNKVRGRGMASGFWGNATLTSSARGRVNEDGSVTLVEGSCDIGGSRTSIAMQMAETLGISEQDIVPIVGDTDDAGYTAVTGGSRTTAVTGLAAYNAANEILAKMSTGLAEVWEVKSDNITSQNGRFSCNGHDLSFKEAAALLHDNDIQVTGQSTVTPKTPAGAFSCQAADIELDLETGKIEILRYTIAQDAGTAIYPPYVEGQMQGGVAQGIGWALNEEYWYDGEGHLRNSSLLDYRMPTALDLPMIDTIIVEVPNPDHPYGVRGVGEVCIVPPPAAIANAIHNAVGVRMHELPMSPPKVTAALANAGKLQT